MNWEAHHARRAAEMAAESKALAAKVNNPDAYSIISKDNVSGSQVTGFNNSKTIGH